jgi:pimeloyl-ACP methyl ester carboxylesterase
LPDSVFDGTILGVTVPTIVLLHGQPDSSASFWPLRRELRKHLRPGVRIVAPDRPGYGANPLPATSFAGNVDWLRRWLHRIDAGPIILLGHSWAGGIAILASAGAPAPIAGLVLLASIGPACLVPMDSMLGATILGEALAYSTLHLARPMLLHTQRMWAPSKFHPADADYAMVSRMATRHRAVWRSFLTEQRALLRELPIINGALPSVTLPTRIIAATQDRVIPDRTPAALLSALPRASRTDVKGGHDLHLAQAVEVARVVSEFAEELLGCHHDELGMAAPT